MKKCFLAFGFDNTLNNLILEQKQEIYDLVGDQTYLSEPPHSTITLFNIQDEKILDKLQELASKISKININLSGFHVFYDDILTNGHSITYSYSPETVETLKKIQIKIVNEIQQDIIKLSWDSEAIKKMNSIMIENIENYGFPYIGEIWIPHITLASIDKQVFGKLFEKIKEQEIKGNFSVNSLDLYEISTETKLIKRFELK